jgi:hypothetical protein
VAAVAILGATILVAASIVGSVALVALAGESDSPELVSVALKFSGAILLASFALAEESTKAGTVKAGEI